MSEKFTPAIFYGIKIKNFLSIVNFNEDADIDDIEKQIIEKYHPENISFEVMNYLRRLCCGTDEELKKEIGGLQGPWCHYFFKKTNLTKNFNSCVYDEESDFQPNLELYTFTVGWKIHQDQLNDETFDLNKWKLNKIITLKKVYNLFLRQGISIESPSIILGIEN